MKLLFVDCCISQRGQASRTRALADAFLEAFRAARPEAEIETVPPEALLALRPFDPDMLNDRDALAAVGAWDAPVFELARQFRAADRIVVAAPFWDLSFPAALRTYIEYISANGLTYHYEADGCHGDCRAERLAYLTSGGDFEREDSVGVPHWRQLAHKANSCHGDCKAERLTYLTSGGDFEREDSVGVLHWRQLAAMFGIGRFDYVFAGGLDVDPAKAPELLAAACDLAKRLAESF